MNLIEIIYKLLLDVLIFVLIVYIAGVNLTVVNFICFAALAHTINWIINCQPVALLMHMDIGKNNPEKFIKYIEGLEKRVLKKDYLAACASYGSLSIGNYKPTSDIDIRVIMKDDLFSRIKAANFCFIERVRAFLSFFPLDLYAFTLEEVKRKMSPKEPPVIFSDPESILKDTYDELISFEEFNDTFKRVVLKVSDS